MKKYNDGAGTFDDLNFSGDADQPKIKKVVFQQFEDSGPVAAAKGISPVFHPVNLKISAELGKMQLKVSELINLDEGSVLRLNRAADEKVLILINDTPFAHGEIVVINDRFAVRVTSLVDKESGETNDANRKQEGRP